MSSISHDRFEAMVCMVAVGVVISQVADPHIIALVFISSSSVLSSHVQIYGPTSVLLPIQVLVKVPSK
jgi:hypothetical protein